MPRKKSTDENEDTKEIAVPEGNEPGINGSFFKEKNPGGDHSPESNSAGDRFAEAGSTADHSTESDSAGNYFAEAGSAADHSIETNSAGNYFAEAGSAADHSTESDSAGDRFAEAGSAADHSIETNSTGNHSAEAGPDGSADDHLATPRTPAVKRATAKSRADKAERSSAKEKQTSFYDLDFNELDKDLSPDQLREWTAIYASFRSKSELTGAVIGVDSYRLKVSGGGSKESVYKQVLCLVIMDFRVKILIPETEVWHEKDERRPDYVIRSMIGAEVDYVVTHVDREGECALASRKMALNIRRNRFFADRRGHKEGEILDCRVIAAGPKRLVAECQGFDFTMTQRDVSYAAIDDLRREYKAGQHVGARLKKIDAGKWNIMVSVKEVNPNPFDGADARHPAGCVRQAFVTGRYGGGLFCKMTDDTSCLCLYSPGYYSENCDIGDKILVRITRYDYKNKLIYGKMLAKA